MPYTDDQIRPIVRRVLLRILQGDQKATFSRDELSHRPVVTAEEMGRAQPGIEVKVAPDALVTPLARQVALERGITLTAASDNPAGQTAPAQGQVVAIGCDHGGFEMKEDLKAYLLELGYRPLDCGTHSKETVDYPDFAFAVARQVADRAAFRGIVIDGAGIGSCMAAHKVPGIRAE